MNISGITRANFVLPSHRDNLLRGINVNVLTVNTLVSVDAAFSLVGVIINAIVSYAELIIAILHPRVGVYPGINMLTFKIAVGIVVTIDGNFNIVRFPNLIAEFGIAWYSKRLNRFLFFLPSHRMNQSSSSGQAQTSTAEITDR